VTATADDLVRWARQRIQRVGPHELSGIVAEGGIVVDIRPAAQRQGEGELPNAVVVDRNVLEWRLDPNGAHRLPEVRGHWQPVVIVCSEGYASSLAAASLVDLGYQRAADLVGGYQAWRSWFRHSRPTARPPLPRRDTDEWGPGPDSSSLSLPQPLGTARSSGSGTR
jgi:rhodanese-related sulfurtransferase